MPDLPEIARLGTRGSELARWQTNHVAHLLHDAYPHLRTQVQVIQTQGDRVLDKALPAIGGKGLFTAELERALLDGDIDIAVHSLKDLPTAKSPGLIIGAVPARAAVEDVLVSRSGQTLDELPAGAVIGTSSHRRAAQLRHHRRDLTILDIRGNVGTRIEKTLDPEGPYDATVLAHAGVARLGLENRAAQVLPASIMLNAPGQGALGIQCRDEAASHDLLAPLVDPVTLLCTTAERAFLATLEGGCSVPVAALGQIEEEGILRLHGRITAVDGQVQIDVNQTAQLAGEPVSANEENLHLAYQLGVRAAEQARSQGADAILAELRK